MSNKSRESSPGRRSHDRLDRQLRQRRIISIVVGLCVLGAAMGGYWWYSRRTAPRDGAPNWFPDGRVLVVAAESDEGRADIHRLNLDGGGREAIAAHAANDTAPAVSPDGTRVAFESDRDGNSEIYVVTLVGGQVQRLTDNPARDSSPAWSPDGRRIVFTSDRDNRASADVYIMNADGSEVQRVTDDRANWAPQFSPDGQMLAVQIDTDVVVIDLRDGSRRRLTSGTANGMNPTWSPDGSRIAFVTTRNRKLEIFTMNADGSNQTLLVSMSGAEVLDPRWSPDGEHIAFVRVPAAPERPSEEGGQEDMQAVYTVEVNSGVVRRVSR
jgi:Tol biopolymer transport system component